MNTSKALVVSATLLTSFGAQADVAGSLLAGASGSFLSLSSAGLGGGGVATLAGGTIYTEDMPFADIPAGSIFESRFLAVGPLAGQPATLTFTTPVSYLSFLWGSPDTYNVLTVNSTGGGSQVFSTASLGFTTSDGDQTFSQYVQFTGLLGSQITSLVFTNQPATDAFETANYSITPVPEPETYALLLAGLGAIGFIGRRKSRFERL